MLLLFNTIERIKDTLFRMKQSWNRGPRGYPYYRASYLTTFKYYLQLIKLLKTFLIAFWIVLEYLPNPPQKSNGFSISAHNEDVILKVCNENKTFTKDHLPYCDTTIQFSLLLSCIWSWNVCDKINRLAESGLLLYGQYFFHYSFNRQAGRLKIVHSLPSGLNVAANCNIHLSCENRS